MSRTTNKSEFHALITGFLSDWAGFRYWAPAMSRLGQWRGRGAASLVVAVARQAIETFCPPSFVLPTYGAPEGLSLTARRHKPVGANT